MSRVLRGEQVRDLEIEISRKDKEWVRILNCNGGLVREQTGAPLLAVVSMADITERKAAEASPAGERRAPAPPGGQPAGQRGLSVYP